MNKSIKIQLKTLNCIQKYNYLFKYIETGRYNYGGKIEQNYYFNSKFIDHWNLKFSMKNKNNNTLYNYITCNTTKPKKSFEIIGNFLDKNNRLQTQYINYDYQAITTQETDVLFIKSNNLKHLVTSERIENLLFKSNKIDKIELELNKGMECFSKCLRQTNDLFNCKQKLFIEHNEHFELIFNLFFYK